jgi:hypothetical protein
LIVFLSFFRRELRPEPHTHILSQAKFLVPDRGIKSTLA